MARLALLVSLDVLNVNYEQWHEMQLEKIILETIAPGAEVPETAILDFIVAISVLPMATFTTISVLGGSQNMPRWMFGQELSLESLRAKELDSGEEPKGSEEGDVVAQDEGKSNGIGEGSTSRMIDTPFDIFGED